jgi:NAD(P) transhydrogenase subunit beta
MSDQVQAFLALAYLVSAVLFIMGLRQLASPRTAPRGNATSAVGMLIALVATLLAFKIFAPLDLVIGIGVGAVLGGLVAARIQMTAMPQLVALFNGLGGAASALVVAAEVISPHSADPAASTLVAAGIGILIGNITLMGSLLAFGKLQGVIPTGAIRSNVLPWFNLVLLLAALALTGALVAAPHNMTVLLALAALSLVLGVTGVMSIGGADMPVMIAFLNSLSGLAASAAGFAVENNVLIIAGSLVGASGVILTNIMCKGMNRSLFNVMFAGVGVADGAGGGPAAPGGGMVKQASPEEAALMLCESELVIVVPGYGLAVAQAQHTVRQLADELEKKGVEVLYGVHPVAGRMPGHMNVLLAEADVDYEKLKDLDEINPEFPQADTVLIVGANDVVNPLARTDSSSPIFGMPILDADKAGACIVLKRSMRPGFSGIDNPLYTSDRTMMVFGDAKDTLVELVAQVKQS